ncbi:3',5'-cyclic-nucleotide phosphodiesterase PDE1 [Aspergillus clavatus NRRL 1]|uniref:cAMP-specific phosphodiesterase, putative n=1 Tax=Aspergillus clavatus (strain ATCC 1007 / CBS 513.65 / DSM 816 / NCTC 3887 / NRRL 1 / QM 1276 / 107) TaxID=344612 RepID=A1CNW9_ASPCL|nr:cAMP-specific phosphodiesterase, putative [Aspergillus clavatus NRRL 1]EAW07340.1 cAMP-specific phosphodiesterase, putative [Aspergillus clavatus NRRL 1]
MAAKATFQVIVLGPTGGPREDSLTGLLVRSTATNWSTNSVIAVDAGTLVSGIIYTLEKNHIETKDGVHMMNDGPFAGLRLPYETAQANAAHIFRDIIGAVLITHAHLDHLSGLAINTPMLEAGNGPKPLAALPSIVAAIKNHMFNDVIWPNLSDEDGGAGLLTYQRLIEGGNPRFGRGDAKGYIRACDGLLARCLGVSHGRCRQRYHPESGTHHRVGSSVFAADPLLLPSRAISVDHTTDAGIYSPARSPRLLSASAKDAIWATVDSSVFFLRDHHTGNEIVIFGDVEPDSISLDPRNKRIWETAAPKIVAGKLRAIFIECSYDDSVDDASLYGHLCPRHLIAELSVLAGKVVEAKHPNIAIPAFGKRKRSDTHANDRSADQLSPRSKRPQSFSVAPEKGSNPTSLASATIDIRPRFHSSGSGLAEVPELVYDGQTPSCHGPDDIGDHQNLSDFTPSPTVPDRAQSADSSSLPLSGLPIYIIHIKEDLTDDLPPRERILQQLRTRGEAAKLGLTSFALDLPLS